MGGFRFSKRTPDHSAPEKSRMMAALLEQEGVTISETFGNQSVKCPFHGDRTPSASVHYDEGLFKCFTCDVAGDVYEVLMRSKGMTFGEAVEYAEEHLDPGGSDVPRQPGRRSSDVFGKSRSGRARGDRPFSSWSRA